jgi:hypothetical protein
MDDDPNFSKEGAVNISLNISGFLKEQAYSENLHELSWHVRKVEHKVDPYMPTGRTKKLQYGARIELLKSMLTGGTENGGHFQAAAEPR